METHQCINAAKNNLASVRRYLESGDGINWVADSLGTALCWAVEGWLGAKGHHNDHAHGWATTRELFLDNCPANLRPGFIHLWSATSSLELDLWGDSELEIAAMPMAQWKAEANELLVKTEEFVRQLLLDIESVPVARENGKP